MWECKKFERIFQKNLKKPGLFQISFEKARKSPAKKPGLFWAGLFTLTNPAKNPLESLQSASSNDPALFQHNQGEAGHLHARWTLGHP